MAGKGCTGEMKTREGRINKANNEMAGTGAGGGKGKGKMKGKMKGKKRGK